MEVDENRTTGEVILVSPQLTTLAASELLFRRDLV
jgi:hypothetical protein